jgi:hypothetical protein
MELMVSLLSMDRPPGKQVELNPPLPLEVKGQTVVARCAVV